MVSAVTNLAKVASKLHHSEPSETKKSVDETKLQPDMNDQRSLDSLSNQPDSGLMPPPSQTQLPSLATNSDLSSKSKPPPTRPEPSLVMEGTSTQTVSDADDAGKDNPNLASDRLRELKEYAPFTKIPSFGDKFQKAPPQSLNHHTFLNIPLRSRLLAKQIQWMMTTRADILPPKHAPFLEQVAAFVAKWYQWSAEIPDPKRRAEVHASIERNWENAVRQAIERGLASRKQFMEEASTARDGDSSSEGSWRNYYRLTGSMRTDTRNKPVTLPVIFPVSGPKTTNEDVQKAVAELPSAAAGAVPFPVKNSDSAAPPTLKKPSVYNVVKASVAERVGALSSVEKLGVKGPEASVADRKRKAAVVVDGDVVSDEPEAKKRMTNTAAAAAAAGNPKPDNHNEEVSSSTFLFPATSPLLWPKDSTTTTAVEGGEARYVLNPQPRSNKASPLRPKDLSRFVFTPSTTTPTKPLRSPGSTSSDLSSTTTTAAETNQERYLRYIILPKVNKLLTSAAIPQRHINQPSVGWKAMKNRLVAIGISAQKLEELEREYQHGYEGWDGKVKNSSPPKSSAAGAAAAGTLKNDEGV